MWIVGWLIGCGASVEGEPPASPGETPGPTSTPGLTSTEVPPPNDTALSVTGTPTTESVCPETEDAWEVDLAGATWLNPPGGGGIVATYLTDRPVVQVMSYDGTQVYLGVSAFPGDCTALPPALVEQGAFGTEPTDARLLFSGLPVPVHGLYFAGTFAEDCHSLERLSLGAELDARDLVALASLFLGVGDAEDLCGFAGSFGVPCGACSADGNPTCVAVELEDVPSLAVPPACG